MINWVVFDLGDVVLKGTTAFSPLAALLQANERSFTEAYFGHRRDYDRHSDAGRFWASVAGSAGVASPDPDLIAELVRVDDLGWSIVDPDTLELIEDLHRAGVQLAVLSNAPSSMGRLVQAQPWATRFQQLFFSGDLGLVKPDPQIYRYLLEKLGAEAGQVAFLDDRADNIEAAAAVGLAARQFSTAAQARRDLRALGLGV